jgi:hypothetical protein
MSVNLQQDANKQHDDCANSANTNIFKTFQTSANAIVAQGADGLMRGQAGFGLVDFGH